MTVQKLTNILQNYCHEGKALDEIEVLDKDGNKIYLMDHVEIKRDSDKEVLQIMIKDKL